MSDQKNDDTELIRHVMETAEAEAKSIQTEAESSIAQRKAALEKRVQKIQKDAEDRIAGQEEKLVARADATIELERGRSRLRQENRIYRAANDRVKEVFHEMRDGREYPGILRDWIVEAVLGLGQTEAVVGCSSDDRDAVKAALDGAIAELRKTHGVDASLTLDEQIPVSGQGVVVRSVPPTVAYSNTVEDRMRRFGSSIRSLVYHAMIEDTHE